MPRVTDALLDTIADGVGSFDDTAVGEPLEALFAGRFVIESLLGAGGMGSVYRAYDRKLDEVVAVKVIRPELVRPEMLEGSNQYLCSMCNKKVNATRRSVFGAELPPILNLSFLRYRYDWARGRREKLHDRFSFPRQDLVHESMSDDGSTFASVVELQAQLILHALTKSPQLQVLFWHAPDANMRPALAVAKGHIHAGKLVRPSVVRDEGQSVIVQAPF